MCCIKEFSTLIQLSINNLIEKEGYLTYKANGQKVSTNGANFLGELYQVDLKGKTKDGDKETNLFLKINNGSDKTNWVSINNIYQIELFTYKELFEIYAGMQEDAQVPLHERFKMIKCYEDSSTEAIILENIAKKGYKMYDRAEVVSLEFAELSIKELAKLHGLSFAFQEKEPDYFNRKIKKMQYPINFEQYHGFVTNMIDLTMKYIGDDVKSRAKNVYNNIAKKHGQFFNDETARHCICHGDYKSNNMMIKTNEGKVIDFIAFDYQFLHYGCPAMDMLYFIYFNTDRQFRKAHLSHLKDLYHETLTTFLGYFNINVDLVYSRETFEQDFKAKLNYGLLVGFALLPVLFVIEDDTPDMTGDLSEVIIQVKDTYKDRQRGIIEELLEWGYI